jgi:hypothetical protein
MIDFHHPAFLKVNPVESVIKISPPASLEALRSLRFIYFFNERETALIKNQSACGVNV